MPRATKNEFTKSRKTPKKQSKADTLSAENSKKGFLFVRFQGLGCKGASLPAPTPAIGRPGGGEWESKRARNQNPKRKRVKNTRNQENSVVVDIPDAVCCAPPGIGISSDFAPRPRNIGPRSHQRKMLMSQQSTLSRRIFHEHDRHHGWRLNVDNMSYEELLELSDRIGYVGSGLQEEEIFSCLRKFNSASNSLPMAAGQKDWKCSICQVSYAISEF
ncbi:RING/U-box superfamily protein [Striga hermonthica]|uniref:RING-type E3 ubiquitin transferase n=1 Tax=Striga hermonthica TaxID=68872 RepID=A0A9N7P014_STRHE|nr:RING/U-box superfamily protein [Striga hermonthica]